MKLFDTYRIVMLGEIHESRQEHELLRKLIVAPGFADKVNDIVVEFGNSRYQGVVDRYVAGENVPTEQVQKAWRDTEAIGPVSPIYGEFYNAVRLANQKLPKQRQLRVLLGDPPVDWEQVHSREDLGPFLPFRDQFYASVVRYEVIAKRRKALLVMGSLHFQRNGGRPGAIENELLASFVRPYVIMPGSNVVGGYDDIDRRFDQFPTPSLVEMKGNWLGDLQMAGGRGGPTTWAQTADAYLYLGPRDILTLIRNPRSDLDGTPYGREIERRLTIMLDKAPEFLPKADEPTERPAYTRASPGAAPPAPPPMPSPRP